MATKHCGTNWRRCLEPEVSSASARLSGNMVILDATFWLGTAARLSITEIFASYCIYDICSLVQARIMKEGMARK